MPTGKGRIYQASLVLLALVAGLALAGVFAFNRLIANPLLFAIYWLVVVVLALALLTAGVLEVIRIGREYRRVRRQLVEKFKQQRKLSK